MLYGRRLNSLAWNANNRKGETDGNVHVTGGSYSAGTLTLVGSTGFETFSVSGFDSGGSGDIVGSVTDTYIPIGTAVNTIGDFVPGFVETNNLFIGKVPASLTTDGVRHLRQVTKILL